MTARPFGASTDEIHSKDWSGGGSIVNQQQRQQRLERQQRLQRQGWAAAAPAPATRQQRQRLTGYVTSSASASDASDKVNPLGTSANIYGGMYTAEGELRQVDNVRASDNKKLLLGRKGDVWRRYISADAAYVALVNKYVADGVDIPEAAKAAVRPVLTADEIQANVAALQARITEMRLRRL